jgi:hypothetical protein
MELVLPREAIHQRNRAPGTPSRTGQLLEALAPNRHNESANDHHVRGMVLKSAEHLLR